MNPILCRLETAPLLEALRVEETDEASALRLSERLARSKSAPLVVIDTNVLLDFWVWDDPVARPLLDDIRAERVVALRSVDTVDELADVLSRSHFDLSVAQQTEILREWHALSFNVVVSETAVARCKDRDDQKFLNLARSAGARYLISKDKLVLKTARRARLDGFDVMTPESWRRLRESTTTDSTAQSAP